VDAVVSQLREWWLLWRGRWCRHDLSRRRRGERRSFSGRRCAHRGDGRLGLRSGWRLASEWALWTVGQGQRFGGELRPAMSAHRGRQTGGPHKRMRDTPSPSEHLLYARKLAEEGHA